MASQLELQETVENPVRILARTFAYIAAVFNDEEVLTASDQMFCALNRATDRYRLTLEAPSTRAIETGQNGGQPEHKGGGTNDDS